RELREKIAAGSESARDYLALTAFLFEARRFEECLHHLREASLRPLAPIDKANVLIALGWYLIELSHDAREPLELGQQAASLTNGLPSSEALVAQAEAEALIASCYSLAGSPRALEAAESALTLLRRVLDEYPNPGDKILYDVHLQSARLNCLLNRTDDAIAHCEQARELASGRMDTIACLTELGIIYRDRGRLQDAREILFRATMIPGASANDLVRPYFELGLTEQALGELPEARAKLRRAVSILQEDPALPQGHLPHLLRAIGDVSFSLQDLESASEAFRAASQAYPP